MNIQPIDNNAMKVTLDSDDLEHFGIDLHRDTYGSPKMEQLFRRINGILRQEHGFNPDGQPVAIEAIPMSVEQLVLNFFPVDYPEEVGNGYAHFTSISPEDEEMGLYDDTVEELPFSDGYQEDEDSRQDSSPNTGERDFFGSPRFPKDRNAASPSDRRKPQQPAPGAMAVSFRDFQTAGTASSLLPDEADEAESCLFRMGSETLPTSYVLFIRTGENNSTDLRDLARTLSEYGRVEFCTDSRLDYYREHGACLIRANAVATLRRFS
jgi:negative regulator of genetic competence, sporulation and motility